MQPCPAMPRAGLCLPQIRVAIALAALLSLFAGGCGDSGPQVVPVTGTVTHNGEPIVGLWVTFVPEFGGQSTGISKENGEFALTYSKQKKGALVGKHTVNIMFRPTNMQQEMEMARGKKIHPAQDQIMKKYGPGSPDQISVEVSRKNHHFDLKLD